MTAEFESKLKKLAPEEAAFMGLVVQIAKGPFGLTKEQLIRCCQLIPEGFQQANDEPEDEQSFSG